MEAFSLQGAKGAAVCKLLQDTKARVRGHLNIKTLACKKREITQLRQVCSPGPKEKKSDIKLTDSVPKGQNTTNALGTKVPS